MGYNQRYTLNIKYSTRLRNGSYTDIIPCKSIIEVNEWVALFDDTVTKAIYIDNVTTQIIAIKP